MSRNLNGSDITAAGGALQADVTTQISTAITAALNAAPYTVPFVSGAYLVQRADLPKTLNCASGASDVVLTLLSAADAGAGSVAFVRKTDTQVASTGARPARVIVTDGSYDLAWLQTAEDWVALTSDGSAWRALDWKIAPVFVVFTASGTWVRPPLLSKLRGKLIGAGGSGASGARNAASTIAIGGAPGGGGYIVTFDLPASLVASSEAVSIGAGGNPGTAVTTDNTSGVTASNPVTSTYFGTHASALYGARGIGGLTTAVMATASSQQSNYGVPGQAPSSSATAAATGGDGYAGSGSPGASITAANGALTTGAGGKGSLLSRTAISGGAVPVAGTNGGAGNPGLAVSDYGAHDGGSGGSGGLSSLTAVGADGADGGAPGGGGGGGAGSRNGFNSGNGGRGGRGELRLIEEY